MECCDMKLAVDEIRPLFRAAGGDIELLSVDRRRHFVLIKLILPAERCRRPVVDELRTLEKEIRRRHPNVRSIAIVEATRKKASSDPSHT